MEKCLTQEQFDYYLAIAERDFPSEVKIHLEYCNECSSRMREGRDASELISKLQKLGVRGDVSAESISRYLPAMEACGYQILKEIKHGGQGIVYEALQLSTHRRVALKMLSRGLLANERERRRFEREIEIVASMRHPNIVTLYQSGETASGMQYFAMEFIDGIPLDQYWGARAEAGHRPTISQIVEHFIIICDAVEYAHRRGVIHRDLKPSNILVDAFGAPRILDFGLAKETKSSTGADFTNLTQVGQFVGTPAFAAPEQLRGDPAAVDSRADIFALGCILYQLLTGEVPHPIGRTAVESIDFIMKIGASAPGKVQRKSSVKYTTDYSSADLDAIILKMLAGRAEDRFSSASAVSDDLRRLLDGRPVAARETSRLYLLQKQIRRSPIRYSLIALFVISAGVYAKLKLTELDESRDKLYFNEIDSGRTRTRAGEIVDAQERLWRVHLNPPRKYNNPAFFAGVPLSGSERTHWALAELYTQHPCLRTFPMSDTRRQFAFFKNDDRVVGTSGSTANIYNYKTGELLRSFTGETFISVCVAPDGKLIAFAFLDGAIHIYNPDSGERLATLQGSSENRSYQLEFTPNGSFLAAAGGVKLCIWDWRRGTIVSSVEEFTNNGFCFAMKSDGSAIFASGYADRLRKYNISNAGELGPRQDITIPMSDALAFSLRISADSSILGAQCGGKDQKLYFITLDGVPTRRFMQIAADQRFAILPRGNAVITTSISPPGIQFRESIKEPTPSVFLGHTANLGKMEVKDDLIASLDVCGIVKIWPDRPRVDIVNIEASKQERPESILSIDLDSSGEFMAASFARGGAIAYYSLKSGEKKLQFRAHNGPTPSISVDPTNRSRVATAGSDDGTVAVWDLEQSESKATWRRKAHNGSASFVAFSPDGAFVASAGNRDGNIIIWNAVTGEKVKIFQTSAARISSAAWHPKGRYLASGGGDKFITIFDLEGTAADRRLAGHTGTIHSIDWSRDGEFLVTGGGLADNSVGVWSFATGERVVNTKIETGPVYCVCFSPDGRHVAAGDAAGNITLINARDGANLITTKNHSASIFSVVFSLDGKTLYSSGGDECIKAWDVLYTNRCIAGNVNYQLSLRPETAGGAAAARLREWSKGVLPSGR